MAKKLDKSFATAQGRNLGFRVTGLLHVSNKSSTKNLGAHFMKSLSASASPRSVKVRHNEPAYPDLRTWDAPSSWSGDPRDMSDEDLAFFGLER